MERAERLLLSIRIEAGSLCLHEQQRTASLRIEPRAVDRPRRLAWRPAGCNRGDLERRIDGHERLENWCRRRGEILQSLLQRHAQLRRIERLAIETGREQVAVVDKPLWYFGRAVDDEPELRGLAQAVGQCMRDPREFQRLAAVERENQQPCGRPFADTFEHELLLGRGWLRKEKTQIGTQPKRVQDDR